MKHDFVVAVVADSLDVVGSLAVVVVVAVGLLAVVVGVAVVGLLAVVVVVAVVGC